MVSGHVVDPYRPGLVTIRTPLGLWQRLLDRVQHPPRVDSDHFFRGLQSPFQLFTQLGRMNDARQPAVGAKLSSASRVDLGEKHLPEPRTLLFRQRRSFDIAKQSFLDVPRAVKERIGLQEADDDFNRPWIVLPQKRQLSIHICGRVEQESGLSSQTGVSIFSGHGGRRLPFARSLAAKRFCFAPSSP